MKFKYGNKIFRTFFLIASLQDADDSLLQVEIKAIQFSEGQQFMQVLSLHNDKKLIHVDVNGSIHSDSIIYDLF